MSDIPDDIMRAANECLAEFRWSNESQWHEFVARALMAERDACANRYAEAVTWDYFKEAEDAIRNQR